MGCTTIQNLPQDYSFLPKQESPFLNITENFIEKIRRKNGKTIHRLRSKQIKVPVLKNLQESSIWKRRMKYGGCPKKENEEKYEENCSRKERKEEIHLLLLKRIVLEEDFRTI